MCVDSGGYERMKRRTVISAPEELAVGTRRMVVYADDAFSPLDAKTAVCLIRYTPGEVAAVIDSSLAPSNVQEVLGFGGDIPIVSSVEESLRYKPNCFVIGMAPRGGMLPEGARDAVMSAIGAGLHIISGMHQFLMDDEEISAMAEKRGVVIWDVRRPPDDLGVSSGRECPFCPVVLTVGSDCNTGKMTAAMQIFHDLLKSGIDASFAASGQTGIMITGRGIPIDRVVSDFIGGATEKLVLESAEGKEVVLLEGQGSILHPGYAGVTIGMIAGALPDAMILCHQPTRKVIRNYTVQIPPLDKLVSLYEGAIAGIKMIPVIGISLNTFDLTEEEAEEAIEDARKLTGLPVTDPVRFGTGPLIDAVRELIERRRRPLRYG